MNHDARPAEGAGSLATSCPTCSTVFRVVQEQLKVSQGWVRCGRCHEVFNALESLFDLDQRDAVPPPRPAAAPRTSTGVVNPPGPATGAPAESARGTPRVAGTSAAPATGARTAPIHGGWDDGAASAYQPDTHRSALDAAAALRERLAARAAGGPRAGRAATSKPQGAAPRSGVFVEETPVDEAELDTRFEPKIFDADAASRAGLAPGAQAAGGPAPGTGETPAPASGVARAASAGAGPAAAPAWDETVVDPSALPLDAADAPPPPGAGAGAGVGADRAPSTLPGPTALPMGAHAGTGRSRPVPLEPAAGVSAAAGLAPAARPEPSSAMSPTAAGAEVDATAMAAAAEPAVAPGADGDLGRAYSPTLAFDAAHAAHAAGPVTTPGFLKEAERKARWQRPQVRAALLAAAVVLGLLVLLQVGHAQRDRLAARWPVLRPALASWCDLEGCVLQAPRQIDALVVETSSLTRPPGVDALRLQVVLRNRVDFEVAAPHVELTLTDGGGAVAARRVFNPGEFGITRAVLGGLQDSTWSLVFTTPLRSVAGYSVSVFYP